jgi:hypothetical protein
VLVARCLWLGPVGVLATTSDRQAPLAQTRPSTRLRPANSIACASISWAKAAHLWVHNTGTPVLPELANVMLREPQAQAVQLKPGRSIYRRHLCGLQTQHSPREVGNHGPNIGGIQLARHCTTVAVTRLISTQ